MNTNGNADYYLMTWPHQNLADALEACTTAAPELSWTFKTIAALAYSCGQVAGIEACRECLKYGTKINTELPEFLK